MRPTLPSPREVIPEAERPDFLFDLPGRETHVGACLQSYDEWEKYHKALGQELAKRIRRGE
jgi:hypothetical protein